MTDSGLTAGTVEANGLTFGYLEAGAQDGPLALCLHGFPDSAHTWRLLLPELAAAGYRAVAPFSRGYAPTGLAPDGAYQSGALAADATALHEAFGGDGRAVLIGHDWGALAAYGAIGYAPGRWRKAVALAVPPVASMMTAFFDYAQLKRSFYIFLFQTPLAEMAAGGNDLAFIDGLWRDWAPGYSAGTDIAHVKDSLREPARLSAAIGYYRAMLDPSLHQDRYSGYQAAADDGGGGCPVLYLHGEMDGALGAELVGGAAEHLPPGSAMEIVPDAGHFLHLERPGLVNPRILAWLTSA
jgi:pimeloyl-ACP methyl ester carboxylesterase